MSSGSRGGDPKRVVDRASVSRAVLKPPNGQWLTHRWADGANTFTLELLGAIQSVCGGTLQREVYEQARVLTQVKHAAKGTLRATEKDGYKRLLPSRTQPAVWELRFSLRGGEVRLYYGEPAQCPVEILLLLAHRKRTDGTPGEIEGWQDDEMARAADRYTGGAAGLWGHITSGFCGECVDADV